MSSPTDPITEADLQGYLEDQLSVPRRIEVEAYLSNHPDDAARIMADLRSRDELRLAFADEPRVEHIETIKAARRLERGTGPRPAVSSVPAHRLVHSAHCRGLARSCAAESQHRRGRLDDAARLR